MKKYGIGLPALALTLLLIGCGDKSASKNSEAASVPTEQQATSAQIQMLRGKLAEAYQPPSTPVQVTGLQSSQVLDIKGIKMLMPQAKATEIIVSNLKNQSQGACKLLNLGPDQIEYWQIADQALVCGNYNFKYFDRDVEELLAFFDSGRLAFLVLKNLRPASDGGKPPLPDFYRALADKFGVKPELRFQNPASGEGQFVSTFFGADGAELEVAGTSTKFANGNLEFGLVVLSFYQPEYDKRVAERLKIIQELQAKAQQEKKVKQKGDL